MRGFDDPESVKKLIVILQEHLADVMGSPNGTISEGNERDGEVAKGVKKS
jgi:hypothetical protein